MKIELSDSKRLIAGGVSIVVMLAAFKLLKGSDLTMVVEAACALFNLALNSNLQVKTEEQKQ